MKQRKRTRNKNLTARERLAALAIGALAVLLFLAAFIVYDKINGADRSGQIPPEKPYEAEQVPASSTPETAPGEIAPGPVAAVADPARGTARLPSCTPPATRHPPANPPAAQAAGLATQSPPERPRPPSPERMGSIVYVIDDAGNNLRELEPFLRFPGALTVAVLPGLPHSAQAARMAREAGKEVFLHQPMEAIGGADPGPGAIYAGMSAGEVRAVLEKNVREIGPIAGMNNHQGSLVTQDEEIMKVVLEFCGENKLYFLDSRTTADTVVPKIAGETGLKAAERNIFLDNEPDRDAIWRCLEQGLGVARKKSIAVMIGHTWSRELAGILKDSHSSLSAHGYVFLTVSEMMEGKDSQ